LTARFNLITLPVLGKARNILSSQLIIGQYRPADSFGHNLDPRAKIISAVYLMIISIFTSSWIYYLLTTIGILLLLCFSKITPGAIWRNIRPFILLVLITALYHLIFSARDTKTIADIWGFRLTAGGINMAVSFSLRVLVFVGIAFFISLTTMPADMADVIVRWLRPFQKLGVPVNDIGLIIFIAMRFIPVLAEELHTLKMAQTVRGVNFSGSLKQRARSLSFLLIPIFQSSVRRADDLAIAIESRGYISGAQRSSFKIYRYRASDLIYLVISTTIIAALFILFG
jgi:energy-coupling factor transport system permease protein